MRGLARRILTLPPFEDEGAARDFVARHDAQYFLTRCLFMAISTVIYAAFLLLDYHAGGEHSGARMAVRMIGTAVMAVATLRFVFSRHDTARHEATLVTFAAGTIGSQIAMTMLAPAEAAGHYQFGLGVVLSLGALMLALQFRTITLIFLPTIGAYLATLPWQPGDMMATVVNATYNLLIAGAVLGVSFERERLARSEALTGYALARSNRELSASRAEALAARDAAVAANLSKNHFLANMSHELRTPLNAIIGFSDMIRSETFGSLGNSRYQGYIEHIHASGTLLQTNIDDLLDLARLESGKFGWEDEDGPLHDIVGGAVATCSLKAGEAGVALVFDGEGPNPVVRADPTRLAQAIINLLTNALKFTEEGGQVRVTTDLTGEGGCLVRVSDTGCGMAPESVERVRVPFAQAHENSYSKGKGGLGLGLAIVSGIVARMDGAFDLQSEEGTGTTATIHLPADRVTDARADAA